MNTAADLMRQHLEGKGMTAAQLAEEIGVSPALVSQIMWGKTRVPRRRLEQIAERLELTEEQKEELRLAFDAIRAPMMEARSSTAGWSGGRRSHGRDLHIAAEVFRKEVAGQLRLGRCRIETEVEYAAMRVDFLVRGRSGREVALLLRDNPDINKRELIDMPDMVRRYFPQGIGVVIVFPYLNEYLLEMRHQVEDAFAYLATPMNLLIVLSGLLDDFDEGLAHRQGELLRHLARPPGSLFGLMEEPKKKTGTAKGADEKPKPE